PPAIAPAPGLRPIGSPQWLQSTPKTFAFGSLETSRPSSYETDLHERANARDVSWSSRPSAGPLQSGRQVLPDEPRSQSQIELIQRIVARATRPTWSADSVEQIKRQ